MNQSDNPDYEDYYTFTSARAAGWNVTYEDAMPELIMLNAERGMMESDWVIILHGGSREKAKWLENGCWRTEDCEQMSGCCGYVWRKIEKE